MRGLAGAGPLASFRRRRALAGTAALAAACAPPSHPSVGAVGDVFVALGRARAIAVLDPATDREVGRISLEALGSAGQPWQLGLSPTGSAAVMPLKNSQSIGLVTASGRPRNAHSPEAPPSAGGPERAQRAGSRRCEWVRVASGRRAPQSGSTPETALALTADAVGHAYVLVGDGSAAGPSYSAVVELETGAVRRHLPLAAAGESVLALQASADGSRLYASVWRWDDSQAWGNSSNAAGRLVALDTRDGRALSQSTLPREAAVTALALGTGPGGGRTAVYATVVTPGPSRIDDDSWDHYGIRHELAGLDGASLATLGAWPLPQRPTAAAVARNGDRAYVLSGSWTGAPWNMRLTALDLTTGTPVTSWPLPAGCLSMAVCATGKLYVADALGDQLWRVDTLRNTFLGSVAQPGAPLSVTARD